jgi:hypothetical protein
VSKELETKDAALMREPILKPAFSSHVDVSQYEKSLPPEKLTLQQSLQTELSKDTDVKQAVDTAMAKFLNSEGYKVMENPKEVVFINTNPVAGEPNTKPSAEVQTAASMLMGNKKLQVNVSGTMTTLEFSKEKGESESIKQLTGLGLKEMKARKEVGATGSTGECCIFNQYGGGGCGPCFSSGGPAIVPEHLKELHEQHHLIHLSLQTRSAAVYQGKGYPPFESPLANQPIVEAASYVAYVKTHQGLEKEFDLQLANEVRDGKPDDIYTKMEIAIGMADKQYQYDSQALADKVATNTVEEFGIKKAAEEPVYAKDMRITEALKITVQSIKE